MPRRFLDLRIRTRIFLSIFVLATSLLVLMSVGVYLAFAQQLTANLDETLDLLSVSNLEKLDTSGTTPVFRVSSAGDPELDAESVLRLYDANGVQVEDASPLSGTSAAEYAVVKTALATKVSTYRTIALADGDSYRVVAVPVSSSGGVTGVLVTGIEWNRVDKPLQILRLTLFTAIPLTALAIGLTGYLIARSALSPVASITSTARQIAELDLNQRIEGVNSKDEIGELASTLNSMIARLHEALERERRFSGDVAHELRTPLAAIEAGIDVTLSQQRDEREYRRVLGVVRRQTQRLQGLSRQLLLLSRMDANALRTEFIAINLAEFSEAVIESFRADHPDCAISLTVSDESLIVMGDLELLARAISNVLENAVTHVGSGVSIDVSVRRLASGRAVVSILDDGDGVQQPMAGDIFGRFRRGSEASAQSGTGLGLAIVDAVMRIHGGNVELVPAPYGSGACFELQLPVAE